MHRLLLLFLLSGIAGSSILHAQTTKRDEPPKPVTLTGKEVTDIIAANRKIVSHNGVGESLALNINGTKQWISVRGRDRRNPILLVLHGGPGSPEMPEDYTFQSPWEDCFTVVEWDQRGTGKTYAANDLQALASTMTPEQMTADAVELIRQLRERYHKQKIFLLGHSWGSLLGVRVAQEHPKWLYAYVGVGQVVNDRRSEADGYSFAVEEAKAHHNEEALKELASIAPYPGTQPLTLERIGVERKWIM
jgi:pimeloyl-ACP methyl ester carboxylesterase